MDADRYREVIELFDQLSAMDRSDQAAELDRIGATDPELRRLLEAYLRQDEELPAFLRTPVMQDIRKASGANEVPADDLDRVPARIGRYTIRRRLGQGGMGVVYLAEQDEPKRPVAIKVIRPGAMSMHMRERFRQEARVLGLLRHSGIAQVYDAGTADCDGRELAYFAMEYVEGVALNRHVRDADLSHRQRLGLIARICEAVHHAHQKGVVHRDLKPDNVLIDPSGQPKILDFGVARATDADVNTLSMHTQVGQIVGTLPYMSPEQALGRTNEIDTRCDVYALGVMAYELLADRLPLDVSRSTILEAARIIGEEEPTRLGLVHRRFRGDIETIIGKALEKDRDRRYGSAADFAQDIRRFLGDEPIVARPASTMYQLGKFARRHRGLVTGLAVAAVMLITGTVVSVSFAVRASRQRDLALEAERRTQLALDDAQVARREAERARDAERLQRDEAEKQTRIARAVNSFLNDDLLGSVSPTEQGKDVSMQEVLDTASRNIAGKFEDQPEVEIAVRTTIANTYRALGRHNDVLEHVKSNLALERRHLGADHRDTLTSQNNLALTYQELGQLDEAQRLLEETLADRRRALGEGDDDVLETMHNLGTLYWTRGDNRQAQTMLSAVLERYRKTLGGEDPRTLDTINNLGVVCRALGRYGDAEALLEEAVETRRRVLGADHPDTLVSVVNAGTLFHSLGRYADARAMHTSALEGFRRKVGEEHPNTIVTQGNLGTALLALGRLEEAEQAVTEAYESCMRLAGPDHLYTHWQRNSLVSLYNDMGRFEQAEPLVLEARKRCTAALGAGHVSTIRATYELGRLYLDTSRLDKAREVIQAGLAEANRSLGSNDFETVRLKRLLADVHAARGRHVEADGLYAECLEDLRDTLPDHPQIGIVIRQHGLLRLSEGKFGEGETMLLEAHERLVASLGDRHPEVRAVASALVLLHDAWHAADPGAGCDRKAIRWRTKLKGED